MKSQIQCCGVVFLLMVYSCATIVMPSGGPKDTTPPRVIQTYPKNKATNFSDSKIVLHFDEFVDLNQPQTNILVSPFSPIRPTANIVGKKMILTFEEGLRANTTYSIDFTNAVKDYNEGNPLTSFNLLFSTGKSIDSGKLMVKVSDAKTKLTSDLTKVCLVKNKSDFFGKNFRYLSNATNGMAQFSNLTDGAFFLFAFVDSNMNSTWDKTESIAFLKESVRAGDQTKVLPLFQQNQAKTNFFVTTLSSHEYAISTSQDINSPSLSDTLNHLIVYQSPRLLKILSKANTFKAQTIRLKYNQDKFETLELPATKPTNRLERLNESRESSTPVFRNDTLSIPWNGLLTKLDTAKIRLKLDGKNVNPRYSIDKNNLVIMGLDYGKNYIMTADSQAFWSFSRYNQPWSQEIITYSQDKHFSEVVLTLEPSLASNKSLKLFQLANQTWIPLQKTAKINFSNLYGDELKIYILQDDNNDGMWTTGDVEKEIQPEKLYLEIIKLEPKKKDYILKISNL